MFLSQFLLQSLELSNNVLHSTYIHLSSSILGLLTLISYQSKFFDFDHDRIFFRLQFPLKQFVNSMHPHLFKWFITF